MQDLFNLEKLITKLLIRLTTEQPRGPKKAKLFNSLQKSGHSEYIYVRT